MREAASRERREFGMSLTRTAAQPLTASELALTAAATLPRRPSSAADSSALLSAQLQLVLKHSAPPKMCAALQQAGSAVLQGWAHRVLVLLRRPRPGAQVGAPEEEEEAEEELVTKHLATPTPTPTPTPKP